MQKDCGTEVGHTQEQVTSNHVRQKPKHQCGRANDERREELNRRDQQVHCFRQSRREKLGLEVVANALGLDTASDESHVRDDGEHHRNSNDRGCCNVDAGNNAGKVHGQDAKKCEPDESCEATTVLITKHFKRNIRANKIGEEFNGHLTATWNELRLTGNTDQCKAEDKRHDHAGKSQA
ncbi:Uncharacterised protein [Chlamydia trachomatis]|nr:Uncharacterised protein [Chlamydia trachomatis]